MKAFFNIEDRFDKPDFNTKTHYLKVGHTFKRRLKTLLIIYRKNQ